MHEFTHAVITVQRSISHGALTWNVQQQTLVYACTCLAPRALSVLYFHPHAPSNHMHISRISAHLLPRVCFPRHQPVEIEPAVQIVHESFQAAAAHSTIDVADSSNVSACFSCRVCQAVGEYVRQWACMLENECVCQRVSVYARESACIPESQCVY